MRVNTGSVVKILQKDAPYNAYGKIGTVVMIVDGVTTTWLLVQFDKPNDKTPYETWIRERDLKMVEY